MADIKSYSIDDFIKNVEDGKRGNGPFANMDSKILDSMLNNIDGSINDARQKLNQTVVREKQRAIRESSRSALEFKNQMKEIEKSFNKNGFNTAYEFNERNGKLIVHIQPRDASKFSDEQRKSFERDVKIEFDTDTNRFGITTRNKQIAADNMRLRAHNNQTVLLSNIQSLAKDFNDAFKNAESQLNKSLGSKSATWINRAIKDIVDEHNNHTATTGSNNYIKKDLKNERMSDSHRLKVSGTITPQQLAYNATKGAGVYYGDLLKDIVKETKNSIIEKMKQEKVDYERATQMAIEDLNEILAFAATQDWENKKKDLDKFVSSMVTGKKYFTAEDKKSIVKYLSGAAFAGGGYGLGTESGYAQHRFIPNRASGSAPFGFGYARENRSWMQSLAIATPRGRQAGRKNPLLAYDAGQAGRELISSIYALKLQKSYEQEQEGNHINFASSDQYNVAQISQAGLNRGLEAVRKEIARLKTNTKKEDHSHAAMLERELLKFKDLGITEGGMILKGDMKDELEYIQEINRRLHSDVNFNEYVSKITDEDLKKAGNKKPFNKAFIKSLREKGLKDAEIQQALKEKLAIYKLFGKDLIFPDRDFEYEHVLDEDKNVTGFKIYQKMMGQAAHRLVSDTGMRVAPSYAGPHSNEIFDIILKELGFKGETNTVAGFIGMEKKYSDRKIGEQINGVLKRSILEMTTAKTIGKFVEEFNKNYGAKALLYSEKSGLRYNENVVNSKIDKGDKSQNMYDFYEKFFTTAEKYGGSNPYRFENGTAFLKDEDLLIQTMGLNPSDIWTYGSAYKKGGKWMSVDDKVIASLNRMLGEGDDSKKDIITAIKSTYKISGEKYDETIKQVQKSYGLTYKDEVKDEEKTLELDLKSLQEKYKQYSEIKDKYTTEGQLTTEAFEASPLAYIQSQIQQRAKILDVAEDQINAFVRLDKEYEITDPYSGRSSKTNILPINIFRGQKFGSVQEITDEMDNILGERVEDVEGTSLDIVNRFISRTFSERAEAQADAALDYIKKEGEYFYTKEGGFFLKAKKGRLGHGASLTAIGTNLHSGNEFLEQSGVLVSPNQLKGMLMTQSGDEDERKANITYLSDILDKMNIGAKRRERIKQSLESAEDDKAKESILASAVTRAVNITERTDKDLNTNQRAAAFENAKLLTLLNLRYPLIYGQDLGFSSVAASKNIEDSAIGMSMGAYRAKNADFDADKITLSLISSVLKNPNSDYFNKGKEATRRMTEITNKYIQREYANDEIEKKSKGIFDNKSLGRSYTLDSLMEVVSRSNRSQIGTFSLINQAIREGMSDLGLDESAQNGKTAAQAALVRELFTSLEQDSISAKKLSQRITDEKNKGEFKGYVDEKTGELTAKGFEYFYNELENIKKEAFGEGSSVFKDKTATKKWLHKLQGLGVLGEEGKPLFKGGKTQGRLNSLFSVINKKDLSEVLGIAEDQIDNFLDADHDLETTIDMLADALVSINAEWESSGRAEYKGGLGANVIRMKNKILNNYSNMTDYQVWKKYGEFIKNQDVIDEMYKAAEISSAAVIGGSGGGSERGDTDLKVPKNFGDKDKLTGRERFGDTDLSVTGLLNKVFGVQYDNYTRSDDRVMKSILNNDQYDKWVNSLQGSTQEQKEANAKKILANGWLKTAPGIYRHGLAQTKLMAKKFGIDNLNIETLDDIRQAAVGNKNFSSWLNSVDEHSGLSTLQSLENYEFLAKKFYGVNDKPNMDDPAQRQALINYRSALEANKKGAQNYYDMVMSDAIQLIGSETTVRGKWAGKNVQGKIDFLRTVKRRSPYDEDGPEKLFLDIIDFKPGMTKAQYVAQVKKYTAMMKEYEDLAKKVAPYGKGTDRTFKQAFSDFAQNSLIQQFIKDNGKKTTEELFKVMTDKNYAGVLDVAAWDSKDFSVMTRGAFSLDKDGKVVVSRDNQKLLDALGFAYTVMTKPENSNVQLSDIISEEQLAQLTKHDQIANTQIAKHGNYREYWNQLQKRERLLTDLETLRAKREVSTDEEKIEKYEEALVKKQDEIDQFNEDNKLLFDEYKDVLPKLDEELLSRSSDVREARRRAVYSKQLSKLYGEARVGHGKAEDLKAKISGTKVGSAEEKELNLALEIQEKINNQLLDRIKYLEEIQDLEGETNLFTEDQLESLREEDKLLQEKEDHIRNAKLAERDKAQLEALYKKGRIGFIKQTDLEQKLELAGKEKGTNSVLLQKELALALEDQRKENEEIQQQIEQQEKASVLSKEEIDKIKEPEMNRQALEASILKAKYATREGTVPGFLGNFGSNFTKSAKQFLMYQTSFNTMFQKMRQGLKTVENQIVSMNKALVDLQIVTGNTKEETTSLLNSYTKLGKDLGATTTEVANAANSWLRQGYEAAEVTELVTSSLYLSKLGMIDSAQATQNLTSMLKGFKLEATDALSVVDKLVSVDMKAAASAGGIAEALSQFATTAQLSGLDMDKAIAMATTIIDVSQAAPASAGNALKTILSRFGNVKAGAFEDMGEGEDNTSINDVERVIKTLGISLKNSKGDLRDFSDVLEDISSKWESIDEVSKNALATAFAGTRQREAFLVLMENMDKYHDLIEVSANSEGTAIKKYEAYSENLEASQKRIVAAWEELGNNANLQNLMIGFNKIVEGLIDALPTLIKWTERIASLRIGSTLGSLFGSGLGAIGSAMKGKSFGGAVGGFFSGVLGLATKGVGGIGKLQGYSLDPKQTIYQSLIDKVQTLRMALDNNTKALLGKTITQQKGGQGAKTSLLEGNPYVTYDENWNQYQFNPQTGKMHKILKNGKMSNIPSFKQTGDLDKIIKDVPKYYIRNANGEWVRSKDNKPVEDESFKKLLDQQEQVAAIRAQKKAAAVGMMAQMGASMALGGLMGSQNYSKYSTFTDSTGQEIQATMTKGEQAQSKTQSTFAGIASGIPIFGPIASLLYDLSVDNNWGNRYGVSRGLASSEQEASNRKKTLTSIGSNIDKFAQAASSGDLDTGRDQLDNMISTLYQRDEDGNDVNKAGREQYEKYLKDILGEDFGSNLLEITKNMEGDVSAQRKLSQAMLIAQVQAERENLIAGNAKESYQRGKTVDEAWLKYNDLMGKTNSQKDIESAGVWSGLGVGWLAQTGASAALVGTGAVIAGGIASIPVVGWIAAAIAATGVGIVAGIEAAKQAELEKQEELEAANAERGKTYADKINDVEAAIDKAAEDGNTDLISQLQEIKTTIEQVQAEQEIYYGELDASYAEEAILAMKYNEDNLTNFSEAQLKQLGKTEIEKAFGNSLIEKGGLYLSDVFGADGSLSEYAKSLLKTAIKSNNTLNSVYTGEAFTLSEALAKEDQSLLENFATALKVSVDSLKEMEGEFGRIELGDFMSNIDELNTKLSKLTENITFLTDSTKSQYEKEMMIIDQYPELINYIGDTPKLLEEFWKDLGQLANVQAEKLIQEIYDNEDYYTKTLLPKLQEDEAFSEKFNTVGDELSSITSIDGLIRYLARNGDNNFSKAIKQIITDNLASVEAVVDVYNELFDQMDEYKTHLLDEQLENLQDQKEALEQITSQREYENKLLEARNKLETALNEKKRIWREGVGWVYEADQEAIASAEKDLETLNTEKQVSALEEAMKEIEAEKERISDRKDKEKWDQLKDLYESYFSESGSINSYIQTVVEAVKGVKINIGGTTGALNEDITANEQARQTAINGENGLAAAKEKLTKLSKGLEGKKTSEITNEARKAYNDALQNYTDLRSNAITKGYISSDDATYLSATSMDLYNEGHTVNGQDVFLTNDRSNNSGNYYKYTVGDSDAQGSKEAQLIYKDMTEEKAYAHGFLPEGDIVYFWNGKAYREPNAKNMSEEKREAVRWSQYDVGDATDLSSYAQSNPNMILVGAYGNDEVIIIKDGQLFSVKTDSMSTDEKNLLEEGGAYYLSGSGTRFGSWQTVDGNALGNLGFAGGPTFVNELGTEAIITPQGTITSLPSATGIVPADITKNLWQLGELAPAIVQGLMLPGFGFNSTFGAKANQSSVDESFNITNLTMNVSADDSFDADAFVKAIRTRAELSRNNR